MKRLIDSRVAWVAVAVIVLAVAAALWTLPWAPGRPTAPVEKLTLAISDKYLGSALVYIADAKGYFAAEGLEVALQKNTSGLAALASVLAGSADLGTAAETPLLFAAMRGQRFAILATLCTSQGDAGIVARTDRGISTPADLRGKRVGTTLGTTANYLVETMLISEKITFDQTAIIDFKPERLADALGEGRIDVAATWEPYLSDAVRALKGQVVLLSGTQTYRGTFNLASGLELIEKRPDAVLKVLRALARAEKLAAAQPDEAKRIFAAATASDLAEVERAWSKFEMRLSLDQALITLLESEARWAIRRGLVEGRHMPNFLHFLFPDLLAQVKPDAVSIIR